MNIGELSFTSVEQAYQYRCATENNSPQLADKILAEKDSYAVKRIAKTIKTSDAWKAKKYVVLKEIVRAKYEQTPHLRVKLKDTGDQPLYEDTWMRSTGVA